WRELDFLVVGELDVRDRRWPIVQALSELNRPDNATVDIQVLERTKSTVRVDPLALEPLPDEGKTLLVSLSVDDIGVLVPLDARVDGGLVGSQHAIALEPVDNVFDN